MATTPAGWRCTCECHADGDEDCYGCCRGKCTDESNIWKEVKPKHTHKLYGTNGGGR